MDRAVGKYLDIPDSPFFVRRFYAALYSFCIFRRFSCGRRRCFIIIRISWSGNRIYPHVVGNSACLSSIWVLAAVSVGGGLMGVVGMLIFIPVVSAAYALFREVVYLKLKQRKITSKEVEEIKNFHGPSSS